MITKVLRMMMLGLVRLNHSCELFSFKIKKFSSEHTDLMDIGLNNSDSSIIIISKISNKSLIQQV